MAYLPIEAARLMPRGCPCRDSLQASHALPIGLFENIN
ncbi:hypothetical protein D8I24_3357 [Cupriavidus necator H850]|nr:hypothetical protein D8I24_3357 [Cupriavidus necator H850]